MKKIITLITLLTFSISFSQNFIVTPEGIKDKDSENKFLVIEAKDKSINDLYKNALKFINEKYKNPDEVIKGKTENEYLRFVTHAPQFTTVKNGGVTLDISANYTIELRFKEGKVRYEILSLEMTADNGGRNVYFKGSIWKGYPIYTKKNKLRLEETKNDIESYFDNQVKELKDFLVGKKKKDDW